MDNNNIQAGLANIKANAEFNTDLKAADNMHNQFGGTTNYNNDNSQNNLTFNFGMTYTEVLNLVNTQLSLANSKLMEQIRPRLLPEHIDKIKNDFDFWDTYREAVKISAKRKDEITDDMLADIISERIKETNDFSKIILNEAIKTIGKLTKTQIEILHLLAVCHYTFINSETSEQMIEMIHTMLRPLFNTKFNNDDFNYLSYAGCIDTAFIGSFNFYKIINRLAKNKYDMESFKNSEDYKYMEDKWENSQLKQVKPTAVGQYIGLKYHKIKFNTDINDIDKLYKDEE